MNSLMNEKSCIGGSDLEENSIDFEIDNRVFLKRKYNICLFIQSQLVFCGLERSINICF